jgi:hypothetical protein
MVMNNWRYINPITLYQKLNGEVWVVHIEWKMNREVYRLFSNDEEIGVYQSMIEVDSVVGEIE